MGKKIKWWALGAGAACGLAAVGWYFWTLPPVPGLKKPA